MDDNYYFVVPTILYVAASVLILLSAFIFVRKYKSRASTRKWVATPPKESGYYISFEKEDDKYFFRFRIIFEEGIELNEDQPQKSVNRKHIVSMKLSGPDPFKEMLEDLNG